MRTRSVQSQKNWKIILNFDCFPFFYFRSAFLIDVDFHPSKGLYRKLLKYDEDRARGVYGNRNNCNNSIGDILVLLGPKTAFVIPAFEIHASVVTDSKEQLIEAIQRKRAKPVLAEGMEPRSIVEYDPAHVYFIDYPKWSVYEMFFYDGI